MTEDYLKTIVQYLIKIVNNSGVSDKGISVKLDEVIAAVSNIKISAESVNLNTDEVEAKLDTLNQSIIANGDNSDIIDKLTTLGTKLDTIKTAIDVLKTNIESVDTHIQSNTQALNNGIGVVNDKQDAINNSIISASQKMLVSGIINPTHIVSVAAGDTTFDQHVVLCNITNDNISVTIMAADDSQNTTIILAPGWNPVVVKSITGAVENTLVYGY